MKKLREKIKGLLFIFICIILPTISFAEMPQDMHMLSDRSTEDTTMSPNPPQPGIIEGTGTHFEVTDSKYLHIIFDSMESIMLRLESSPEMITFHVETSDVASATQITITGLRPLTTYYKYEDNYHNLTVITTDQDGKYTYLQDITTSHFVFIQPRKSTKFIKDDPTGGDCVSIGIWDPTNKICTLTTDVNETVQIDNDNIVLDGNSHRITGTGAGGYGILLPGRRGVTIRNVNIMNFYSGIYLSRSHDNMITNNNLTNNTGGSGDGGIRLYQSNNNMMSENNSSNNMNGIVTSWSNNVNVINNIASNNIMEGISLNYGCSNSTIINNTALNNNYSGIALRSSLDCNNSLISGNTALKNGRFGIISGMNGTLSNNTASNNYMGGIYLVSGNTLNDNTLQENGLYDLYVEDYAACSSTVQNTVGSGGRPIKFVNSAVNIAGETYSELILCRANYSTISNVTIIGSETLKNNGVLVIGSNYANLSTINSSDNNRGISLWSSNYNTVQNNDTSDNDYGIYVSNSRDNTISGNKTNNNDIGINVNYCKNTLIKENTVFGNWSGIYLQYYSSNNTISNNDVSDSNSNGIGLTESNYNVVKGNMINNNYYGGIGLFYSSNNSLLENVIAKSHSPGIQVTGNNNTVKNNTISENSHGITISGNDNKIYNNNFISNGTLNGSLQAYTPSGSGNVFNLAKPIGGNYWNNFDSPSEGCSDANNDGFCDAPYTFISNADNLPWTKQDGWNLPVDSTSPTTTIMQSGIPGTNYWYKSDVEITLTASDNNEGTGVKEIHYSIDGAVETVVTENTTSFAIAGDGTHTLVYYAKDKAGNEEMPHHTASIMIDKNPPVISASASPASNANGWYNTDVIVTFTCTDVTSGAASCTQPVTVTAEGAAQVITGTAIDNAGNTATASMTVNIDKSAPNIVNLSVNPVILWPPNHKMVDVLIGGSTEDAGSGVASIEITVLDEYGVYNMTMPGFGSTIQLEAWREGTDRDGRHYTITALVTDKAGNRSTATTEVLVPHDMR